MYEANNVQTPNPNVQWTRTLYIGTKGTDVTQLQTLLTQKGYLPPNNTTGTFGPLTQKAVKKFQCEKMSLCSGNETTTGYGVVGKRTREMLAK